MKSIALVDGRERVWRCRCSGVSRDDAEEFARLLRDRGLDAQASSFAGKWTDNQEEMVRLYESGLTMLEVAERMGCSTSPVRSALLIRGAPIRRRGKQLGDPWTDRTRRMASMYENGSSMQEIGEQYDISRERVRQLLKRVGIAGKPSNWRARQRMVERDAAVQRLIERTERMSRNELAAKLGIRLSAVESSLRRLGIRLSKKGCLSPKTRQALEMFDAGIGIEQIARRLGYTNEACVRSQLHRYGRKMGARKMAER